MERQRGQALSAQQLDDELRLSQQYLLTNVGSPVDSFASPMGSYNSTVLSAIKKYYTPHRTVNVGMNSMGSSVYDDPLREPVTLKAIRASG